MADVDERVTALLDELSKSLDAYENELGDRGMPFNEGWLRITDAFGALDGALTETLIGG